MEGIDKHLFIGAPDRIRTCDLMNRNHALYPTELRARFLIEETHVSQFHLIVQQDSIYR